MKPPRRSPRLLLALVLGACGASESSRAPGVPNAQSVAAHKRWQRARHLRAPSEPGLGDDVRRFLGNRADLVMNLKTMEDRSLLAGRLAEQPWSDSYWPIYRGITGNRYADLRFDRLSPPVFSTYFAYVTQPGFGAIDIARDHSGPDDARWLTLSPAEKYDLLVGDSEFRLTRAGWAEGAAYAAADPDGKVQEWMGICHGWAPASFSLARPMKPVDVVAADGVTTIRFFPSDIKALGSLLWANANVPARMVGSRCNVKDPAVDETGRTESEDCRDNNPMAWHLAVVNRVGVQRKSFVMDATYDYEVWNQPVVAYRYDYQNPVTSKESTRLEDAWVAVADYTKDPNRAHRAAGTAYVVGVEMQLTYLGETNPSHASSDGPTQDNLVTLQYSYDLELAADGTVLGGEWLSANHPDFLWRPEDGFVARAAGDRFVDGATTWGDGAPLPEALRAAALRSVESGRNSSDFGQPLAAIVNALIEFSRH